MDLIIAVGVVGGVAIFLLFTAAILKKPRAQQATAAVNDVGSQSSRQLDDIAKVAFETKPLLNDAEQRVFAALEGIVEDIGGGHRVMAQTSMGEVLQPVSVSATWPDRKRAFAAINSKRFDFAIFDTAGTLVMAVEYQGKGHHQKKAFIRDAVKREVCRMAGVPFVEVEPGMKPAALRGRVRDGLAVMALAAE